MPRIAQYPALRGLVVAFAMMGAVACDSTTTGVPTAEEPVAYVEITTELGELAVGQARTLSARLLAADGTVLHRPVAWTSSDTAVATITTAGQLTARAVGTVEIKAAREGVEASITLGVREGGGVAVSGVELQGPGYDLLVGQTFLVRATVRGTDGSELERQVDWTSSNPAVAAVDQNGLITAVAWGDVRISASVDGVGAEVNVAVRNMPAILSQLSPASVQAGSPGFELRVKGTNFQPGSTIRWAGQERPALYISPTELRLDIAAADVQYAGSAEVRVLNPGTSQSAPLYFTIEAVPATHVYDLFGLAWDEHPLLPVQIHRWWELDGNGAVWYHQRVNAGVLRIHDPVTGASTWDLTLTIQVVQESDGTVVDQQNQVFHGTVEYQAPEGHRLLRSGIFANLVLTTLTAHNGDLIVWQTLHPSGLETHEKAWRYRPR